MLNPVVAVPTSDHPLVHRCRNDTSYSHEQHAAFAESIGEPKRLLLVRKGAMVAAFHDDDSARCTGRTATCHCTWRGCAVDELFVATLPLA